MRIQPIVEGHGETDAAAELLRRLCRESGCFQIEIGPPIRRHRSEFLNPERLARTIRRALVEVPCHGIVILFDADKDCPKEMAPRVDSWAAAEAGRIPCQVVMARSEYEAWFLGSLESLRGRRGIREDAVSYVDPESIRGAKERLKANTGDHSYLPSRDQAALTALFDMAAAYRSCRSFRRMVSAFGKVAAGAGATLGEWPPASWLSPP